jgi:hypothetical protein
MELFANNPIFCSFEFQIQLVSKPLCVAIKLLWCIQEVYKLRQQLRQRVSGPNINYSILDTYINIKIHSVVLFSNII